MNKGTKRRRSGAAANDLQDSQVDAAQRHFIRKVDQTSRDGRIHFHLQRVAGGLYVEREELHCRGLGTQLSLHFSDALSFGRWCDADSVRFGHPLLHFQLKRTAADLWQLVPPADPNPIEDPSRDRLGE